MKRKAQNTPKDKVSQKSETVSSEDVNRKRITNVLLADGDDWEKFGDEESDARSKEEDQYLTSKAVSAFFHLHNEKGIPLHTIPWDEKISLIESGITREDLTALRQKFGFTLDELSRILDITPRTIQGKKPSDKFTGHVAERVLALAQIYSYGLEVFEEEEKFRRWMNWPNPIVKNFKPVELLTTMTGMEEVRHLIGRIDYGVY